MIYSKQIFLETDCTSISEKEWDKLMKGAVKANGSKIRRLIKQQLPDLYEALALNFHNPYEAQAVRTKTHFVYVHSAIEYFIRFK